jgi:hypothetical protein
MMDASGQSQNVGSVWRHRACSNRILFEALDYGNLLQRRPGALSLLHPEPDFVWNYNKFE